MSQYEVCEMQYTKNARMSYFSCILQYGSQHAFFWLLSPAALCTAHDTSHTSECVASILTKTRESANIWQLADRWQLIWQDDSDTVMTDSASKCNYPHFILQNDALCPSCKHTACNSMYFVKAAALHTKREGKKYAILNALSLWSSKF